MCLRTLWAFIYASNEARLSPLLTKCVLYARKSTEEDDKRVMRSIEAQIFELNEYASRERIEIVKVFTEAKSAKKPGRDDPGAKRVCLRNG